MSSYNLSSYDIPPDSMVNFKKSEFLQLDMQVSMLQNKLNRAERLLDEFERKEAANSKAFSIIAKHLNRLSNSSKSYVVKGITTDIGGHIKNGGDKGFNELFNSLTTFISSVKVIKIVKKLRNEEASSRSVKSQDYHSYGHNKVKQLADMNRKLTNRLEALLHAKLSCKNCKTQIDIGKAVSSTRESIGASDNLATSSEIEFIESIGRLKSIETSKFSVLKSLKSLLNGDSSIMHAKNDDKRYLESVAQNLINESSIFVKKSDPVKDEASGREHQNTPKHGLPVKISQFVVKLDQSSKYDYKMDSYISQDDPIQKPLRRELLVDFEDAEAPDLVKQVLYNLDTIKSISSKKSEEEKEKPKETFQANVFKYLDNIQKEVECIKQDAASQASSLKQLASVRGDCKKIKLQHQVSVDSYKLSSNKKKSCKNFYSKQTPYFDRLTVDDLVDITQNNNFKMNYNHDFINDVDAIHDEDKSESINGFAELRKSKSLDPRLTDKMFLEPELKLDSVFRFNQPKPCERKEENTTEMFESFKFFNPQSNRTQRTQNVFENGSSEKKNIKPKKQLAFAKTSNDGFFKTMRYDRNAASKNFHNTDKTRNNITATQLSNKEFKNVQIPKIVKQIATQLGSSNTNKLTKPVKPRSPEHPLESLFNKPRRLNNELTKTFADVSRPKTRLQNQNSINAENLTNKAPDSQRNLLNKIKSRIAAKTSVTPRSHLGSLKHN